METIQGACSCLCPTVDTFQWGTFGWGMLAGVGVIAILAMLAYLAFALLLSRHS